MNLQPQLNTLRILGGSIVALGLAYVMFSGADSLRKHQGAKNEVQAQVYKGEANANQAQASQTDAEVLRLKAAHVQDQADVNRARAEVQRLRTQLAAARREGIPNQVVPPVAPDAPDSGGDLHGQLDLAKDGLITKQDIQIQGLKEESALLLKDRDQWKATAEFRQRQALAQEAATNAWKKAVTDSRWRGRVEGFVVGLAGGYAAGRLR